ncbi:DNA methyltransferase [Streptomyces sp. 796.1]|uniref:DNA methyltransferase n=1 Tax=Streptomyces sp. 796.1 TaxID=3163029 RepID=UPI0039C9992E
MVSSRPPGGLALDPFCGTGHSLAVAVKTGRRGLGFEITPNFSAAARANVTNRQFATTTEGEIGLPKQDEGDPQSHLF